MRKIYILAIIFICVQQVYAQQSMTLYNMTFIPQRNQVNPALPFNGTGTIGIPFLSSVYGNFSNSSFKYTDFIRGSDDDSLYLDPENMIGKMKAEHNFINMCAQWDWINFGFKVKKSYFGFNMTEKINMQFDYPKEMMEFLWKGNAATLGKETVINFGLNFMHYREYAVTYSRFMSDNFSFGIKMKYLYGMENVASNNSQVSLYTDPNSFAITAKSNIKVNTSGIEDNSFDEFAFGEYAFGRSNKGYAADLGIAYKVSEKLLVSASMMDIGKITWNSHVVNYNSNKTNGEFTYYGIDLNSFINDTAGATSAWQRLVDTLTTTFKINTGSNSYSTSLPMQFYMSGSYLINDRNSMGLLIHGQKFENKMHPDITMSFNKTVGRWLNFALSYSLINQTYNNVGVGIALNWKDQQYYFVSDNVYGAIYPTRTQNANFRVGINYLFFGKGNRTSKPAPSGEPE